MATGLAVVEHTGNDDLYRTRARPMTVGERPVSFLLVAAGGAIGTLVRWVLTEEVVDPAAAATAVLVLNVAGSFVFGALLGCRSVGQRTRWAVGTGFCGGMTSFSSFAVAVAENLDTGEWADAAIQLVGTVGLAVAGAALGMMAMSGRPR